MAGAPTGPYSEPSFEITHESEPGDVLVAGFSSFGLAGLTAVDFLVEQLDLTETGYVSVEALPAITPFEDGTPRHHTRFFTSTDRGVTVLANELFVPPTAAKPFADAVYDWVGANGVDEIAVLSGVPVPHGPEGHRTYYVATEDFQRGRLGADGSGSEGAAVDGGAGDAIPAMGAGFLDSVNAELVGRGIDDDRVAVGVFLTPVHAQAPDVEAALRLLDSVGPLYDLALDTGPLEAYAAEVTQYYTELAERLASLEEHQRPEERMYM
ncbi:MAG: proteasome assembly chaperone family protein [Halobacteriaceae archaeon]